jgi:hypothetical protein
MASNFRNRLDPLDLEILEGALDGALAISKEDEAPDDPDSDEALEADLRRELIEIARCNGMHNPEALRDMLLAALSNKQE